LCSAGRITAIFSPHSLTCFATSTIHSFSLKKRKEKKHGIKGFVIPTKSYVKIGITKIFCYDNIVLSTERLVAAAKVLAAATKIYLLSLILLPYQNHFFP